MNGKLYQRIQRQKRVTKRQHKKKAEGICIECKEKAAKGFVRCKAHLKNSSKNSLRWRKRNRRFVQLQRGATYYAKRQKNYCLHCSVKSKTPAVEGKTLCQRHLQGARNTYYRRKGWAIMDGEGVSVEATSLAMNMIRVKFHGVPEDKGPDIVINEVVARDLIKKLSALLPENIVSK